MCVVLKKLSFHSAWRSFNYDDQVVILALLPNRWKDKEKWAYN